MPAMNPPIVRPVPDSDFGDQVRVESQTQIVFDFGFGSDFDSEAASGSAAAAQHLAGSAIVPAVVSAADFASQPHRARQSPDVPAAARDPAPEEDRDRLRVGSDHRGGAAESVS